MGEGQGVRVKPACASYKLALHFPLSLYGRGARGEGQTRLRKLQTCATTFVEQDCILPSFTRKPKPQVRKLQTCATFPPLPPMGEGLGVRVKPACASYKLAPQNLVGQVFNLPSLTRKTEPLYRCASYKLAPQCNLQTCAATQVTNLRCNEPRRVKFPEAQASVYDLSSHEPLRKRVLKNRVGCIAIQKNTTS